MFRRISGALTLLALAVAIFASAPAVAKNDCCAKACFCRHETAAARGASCALRKGSPCGFRHPIPEARASAPERPALPLCRSHEIAPPLAPAGAFLALRLGRPSAPPHDPLTPPPRLSSSLTA